MNVKIYPGKAKGEVIVPPSKSMAHRALICAALQHGMCRVRGVSDCDDVEATLASLHALGVRTERHGTDLDVRGVGVPTGATQALPCAESGSTLRFLIPLAMLCGKPVRLTGAKPLLCRPLSVYEDLARERTLRFERDAQGVTVQGPLRGGTFSVPGNISSQFISGLLFALPLADEDSTIRITTALESRPYIDLTLKSLAQFGVQARWTDEHTLFIPGRQSYRASEVTVEGDDSAAAFPDALNLFGGDVKVLGVSPDSIQGDRVYRKYFPLLMRGIPTLYIGDCPDLAPILFAVAAARHGGVFGGTSRLRIKESDRATVMAQELEKFGTNVQVHEDTVVVYPTSFTAPQVPLCGHGDHRIVMALSILLTLTGGIIEGAEAVSKSYPAFFEDLERLGIRVERLP